MEEKPSGREACGYTTVGTWMVGGEYESPRPNWTSVVRLPGCMSLVVVSPSMLRQLVDEKRETHQVEVLVEWGHLFPFVSLALFWFTRKKSFKKDQNETEKLGASTKRISL